MTRILTNPKAIKKFIKQLIQTQVEAYFERLKDNAEMLLVITDTPAQADKIQSFLHRSRVLSDRRSLTVCTQRFPNLLESDENPPFFGIFYVSVHEKAERAKTMNTVLERAITRLLANH
jgi:hypothetical protein